MKVILKCVYGDNRPGETVEIKDAAKAKKMIAMGAADPVASTKGGGATPPEGGEQ